MFDESDSILDLIRGEDGKLSHRKAISFLFTLFVLVMIICTSITGDPHLFPEVVWASIIAGALGMSYIRRLTHKDDLEKDSKSSGD